MVREAEEADQIGFGVGQRVPHRRDVGLHDRAEQGEVMITASPSITRHDAFSVSIAYRVVTAKSHTSFGPVNVHGGWVNAVGLDTPRAADVDIVPP